MDADQLIKATQSTQRLIQDEYFYKYIFKRTERIVSVVFYITQTVAKNDVPEYVLTDMEEAARAAHTAVLRSLEARKHAADEVLFQNIHTLIALESHLQVAQSINAITKEIFSVLVGEIDAAIRSINKYLEHDPINLDTGAPAVAQLRPETNTRTVRKRESSASTPVAPRTTETKESQTHQDRRTQMLTIIEAKGEVGVKDIAAIIKDVSEKTLQRELNDMIDEGLIIREGERRWSRYKLL